MVEVVVGWTGKSRWWTFCCRHSSPKSTVWFEVKLQWRFFAGAVGVNQAEGISCILVSWRCPGFETSQSCMPTYIQGRAIRIRHHSKLRLERPNSTVFWKTSLSWRKLPKQLRDELRAEECKEPKTSATFSRLQSCLLHRPPHNFHVKLLRINSILHNLKERT